jgi:hypothetical protein
MAAYAQGAGREPQGGGGLGRALAQGLAQDDLALAGREAAKGARECGRQLAAASPLVGIVRDRGLGELESLGRGRPPGACQPTRLVARDHRQPCRDVAGRDPADGRQDTQPCLLNGVVGVVGVAEDEGAEPAQTGVVAGHEPREGVPVAVASREREAQIEVDGGRCDHRRAHPRPRPNRVHVAELGSGGRAGRSCSRPSASATPRSRQSTIPTGTP